MSLLIIAYLIVLLLGPLSNPIASKHLTGPLGRLVAPIHQCLFIGHGYRFFGPDPGPSHIVEFVVKKSDGSEISGQFPDRENDWPRLRYHRWFMLSETLFEEAAGFLDQRQHDDIVAQINMQIESARLQNERAIMLELVEQREGLITTRQYLKQRVKMLLQSIANYLVAKHEGETVEIFLRERLIAGPADIRSRVKLTDPRYLSERRSLGQFPSITDLEELQ